MKNISVALQSKRYYDQEEDILWVVFKEGVEERYEEIAPGINAEYDKEGDLIGLELFNASRQLVRKSSLTSGKNVALFNQTVIGEQGFREINEINTISKTPYYLFV